MAKRRREEKGEDRRGENGRKRRVEKREGKRGEDRRVNEPFDPIQRIHGNSSRFSTKRAQLSR